MVAELRETFRHRVWLAGWLAWVSAVDWPRFHVFADLISRSRQITEIFNPNLRFQLNDHRHRPPRGRLTAAVGLCILAHLFVLCVLLGLKKVRPYFSTGMYVRIAQNGVHAKIRRCRKSTSGFSPIPPRCAASLHNTRRGTRSFVAVRRVTSDPARTDRPERFRVCAEAFEEAFFERRLWSLVVSASGEPEMTW